MFSPKIGMPFFDEGPLKWWGLYTPFRQIYALYIRGFVQDNPRPIVLGFDLGWADVRHLYLYLDVSAFCFQVSVVRITCWGVDRQNREI